MGKKEKVNMNFDCIKTTDHKTSFFHKQWKNIELPDFPTNSNDEISEITKKILKTKDSDRAEFIRHDKKSPPFYMEFLEQVDDFDKNFKKFFVEVSEQLCHICSYFKEKYDRPRPQVYSKNHDIDFPNIDTETGTSPSYPSGHSMISYFLADLLSQKFPKSAKKLTKLADTIAEGRVKLGVHYPSDIAAGKLLAKKLMELYKGPSLSSFKEWYFINV